MKRVIISVFGIFILTFSGEVLLQLPFSQVKAIKESPVIPVAFFENSVIGRIAKERVSSLSLDYKILTSLPAKVGERFYIVYPSPYLKRTVARAILKRNGEILMEDGPAFFVRAKEEKILSILHLGFEIANVSLLPVILPEPKSEDFNEDMEIDMQENPVISEILAQITPTEVAQMIRELSGEVPVTVRGVLDTIRTRYATAAKNSSGIWYIYERLQGYNLDSVGFHSFTWPSGTDSNVIGTKNGRVYPQHYWIIGGHCDCTSESPTTYAPGADDNASGAVTAIIAAKYMSPYPWKYTIKFIGWNTEEFGLYGSDAHARLARSRGDTILGVLNSDMIATEVRNNDSVRIYTSTRAGSRAIGDTFFAVNQRYNIGLRVRRSTSAPAYSDQWSYWQQNYDAIWAFEDDDNPYYHTTGDRITAQTFDTLYLTKVIKAMVATLATLAIPDTQINYITEKSTRTPSESQMEVVPNPFRTRTAIRIPPSAGRSSLKIYNVAGKLIGSFNLSAGSEFLWDGKDRDGKRIPGIYFLRLSAGNQRFTEKLILIE